MKIRLRPGSRGPRRNSRAPQYLDDPVTVVGGTPSPSPALAHVITITTTAKFTCAVNFLLTGSAHHRSRPEGTLRRFLSPMTHRHHDATVRQHHAHDPHQSLTSPVLAPHHVTYRPSTTGHHTDQQHSAGNVPLTDWADHQSRPLSGTLYYNEEPSPFPLTPVTASCCPEMAAGNRPPHRSRNPFWISGAITSGGITVPLTSA